MSLPQLNTSAYKAEALSSVSYFLRWPELSGA